MKKTILIFLTIIILALIAYYSVIFFKSHVVKINPDDKSNQIVIISPIKDSQISSPLSISGRARGSWFFEGSFPVILVDQYGNILAESHVTAQGEWMTQDFVKFVGNLQFNNYIKGQKGTLILKKDNPSGLPQNDDSIEIPVVFK